jgi:hypothetical protein
LIFIGDLPPVRILDVSAATLTTSSFAPSVIGYPYYYYSPPAQLKLVACDVTNPAAPSVIAENVLPAPYGGNFSEIYAEAGKLFVTHRNGFGYVVMTLVTDVGTPFLNQEGRGRHFLHVVDYSSPSAPVVRPAVSAPGVLKGLTRGGTVVYTEGYQYNESGVGIGGTQALHVSVYDGQKLELATELPSPTYGRTLTMGDRVFTFYTKTTPETGGKLAAFTALLELQPDLQFAQQDEIRFGGYEEHAVAGVLFTTDYQTRGASIRALDFTNSLDLRDLGGLGTPTVGERTRRLTGDREHGFWLPAGDFGLLKLDPPSP